MRRLSIVAPEWWDYTTLDDELLSDVAKLTADDMLQLSRHAISRVNKNIFWSLAYNVAAVPVAAGALYPFLHVIVRPEIAAVMMILSSLSILWSSLSLRNYVPNIKRFDVSSFR